MKNVYPQAGTSTAAPACFDRRSKPPSHQMAVAQRISIPGLLRIKHAALERLGIYLRRATHERVFLITSEGLPEELIGKTTAGLERESIRIVSHLEIAEASFEKAQEIFCELPAGTQAIVGLGGGKAIDTSKYVAFLARLPFYSVPTSLSNDGFSSPQSSLTVAGRRRSLPSSIPSAVVIDTEVCLAAPDTLWWSGIGDLVAKVTAVADWKLAFHAQGEPIDDFAALISEASVYQFLAHPVRDEEGVRLLGTALTSSGIAMEICGSSRPASGAEHLISHALDGGASARPRLHGLQVGVATYLVSLLQGQGTERIATVLDATGFWEGIEADPFDRAEWLEAVRIAPSIKDNFHTVLSSRDCVPEVEHHLREDERLRNCFGLT